ncbi:hypothetical protein [Rhodobacter calidifons]|uniref:hypothetical protein n=1 Tax=Rhodobacter calidifons TaxID=2715277 RepID=UPI001A99E354|nr:hypothetical protein [Rhodobacter calidifons]
MNTASAFFDGLAELEMENRIRPLLRRHADFDFQIDYAAGTILFWRECRCIASSLSYRTGLSLLQGDTTAFSRNLACRPCLSARQFGRIEQAACWMG